MTQLGAVLNLHFEDFAPQFASALRLARVLSFNVCGLGYERTRTVARPHVLKDSNVGIPGFMMYTPILILHYSQAHDCTGGSTMRS